jgi:hypothetical protein
LAAWTILIVLCAALAVYWMRRDLAPASLINAGLSYFQLLILTLSFFPFIEGLQVGQNHGLTLLLITGILAFSIKERGWAAGVCAGLLLYKPHFAAGFVLLWLVWKNYRALAGFTLVALGWAGAVFVQHGLAPFLNYVEQVPSLMQMIYMDGFGAYLEVTPYGLLTSLLPQSAWRVIIIIIQVILALMSLLLLWYAWKVRKNSPEERLPAMILAILYPLLAAPHALLHDLIILIPAFILWARLSPSRCRLYLAVGVYLAAFLLPPLAYYSGAALLAFIPVGLLGVFLRMASLHLFHPPNPRANSSG